MQWCNKKKLNTNIDGSVGIYILLRLIVDLSIGIRWAQTNSAHLLRILDHQSLSCTNLIVTDGGQQR